MQTVWKLSARCSSPLSAWKPTQRYNRRQSSANIWLCEKHWDGCGTRAHYQTNNRAKWRIAFQSRMLKLCILLLNSTNAKIPMPYMSRRTKHHVLQNQGHDSRSSDGGSKDEKQRRKMSIVAVLISLYHQSDIVHGEAIGHFVP